jgi:CBS domain-containing protein
MKAGAKQAKAAARKSENRRGATGKRAAPARKAAPRHLRDIMTERPVCASLGDSLRDVARLLDEYEISGLPVVDDQDRVVGVISRTDLLRRLLEGPTGARRDEDWLDLLTADSTTSIDVDAARLGTVDDLMSIDPVTAKAEETIATVARRMAEERVHRVIVVDEQRRAVGIATTLDMLRVFPG